MPAGRDLVTRIFVVAFSCVLIASCGDPGSDQAGTENDPAPQVQQDPTPETGSGGEPQQPAN